PRAPGPRRHPRGASRTAPAASDRSHRSSRRSPRRAPPSPPLPSRSGRRRRCGSRPRTPCRSAPRSFALRCGHRCRSLRRARRARGCGLRAARAGRGKRSRASRGRRRGTIGTWFFLCQSDESGLRAEAALEYAPGRPRSCGHAGVTWSARRASGDGSCGFRGSRRSARAVARSRYLAVGAGARFLLFDARLAVLELPGLASGETTRLHALLDTLLLVDVPLHIRLHALRGRRVQVAGLRVVLLAVDVAAHLVLLARKARLFLPGELAVLHGPRLVALDARFLVLEPRRFTGVELAGLESLLDALLLVDIALNRPCLRECRGAKTEADGRGDHAVCKFHFWLLPMGVVEPITTCDARWRRPHWFTNW